MPECRKSSRNDPQATYLIVLCLVAGVLLLPVPAKCSGPDTAIDPRKIYSNQAPRWLRAVGKLQVPGSTYANGKRSHLLEDCSASLVTGNTGSDANIIITAWHCLENYHDLSRPILFSLVSGQNRQLEREAYRLVDGGGMHADWAILRLRIPIAAADVIPLLIHPERATPETGISMAGYSRDPAMGNYGNHLTYHPNCLITATRPTVNDSNCLAYKGASGGAVVQLSGTGTPWYSGVISEGDSTGLSRFVPVAVFRNALNLHLK
jgi:Trypsin-like peptidase domain